MNSDIMKALTGSNSCKIDNESALEKGQSYTASISGADKVYAILPGKVPYIGSWNGVDTVNILISNTDLIRLIGLKDIKIWKNSSFDKGELIGSTNSKKIFQFEYCTIDQDNSKNPIRVNTETYFRQNPLLILNKETSAAFPTDVTQGLNRPNDTVEFTEDQKKEWIDSVGNQYMYYDPNVYQITNPGDTPESMLFMLSNNGGGPDE